jgi:hypothetical protein
MAVLSVFNVAAGVVSTARAFVLLYLEDSGEGAWR